MKDKLQYRKTLFITRLNCPETNSSSSHSFALSRKSLCADDFKDPAQTLIPIITDSGKKIISLDGKIDELVPDFEKSSNSSKVKLMYTLRSIDFLFSESVAKRKKSEVLEMVRETLGIDEVIAKNTTRWDIDHQSTDTLEQLLKTEDYLKILKEFIFNPRAWIFFLWDSEDCYDNPVFEVLEDYSKYEVSIEFPILVEKFQEAPEVQNIKFTKLSKDYPNLGMINEFYDSFQHKLGYRVYNESFKSFIIDPRYTPMRSGWHEVYPDAEELNDPNLFIPLTISGFKEDLYLVFLRSTEWVQVWKNLKEYLLKNDPEFEEDFDSYIKFDSEFSKSRLLREFIKNISPLTEKLIDTLEIDKRNIISFKINIYSRIDYNE